MERKQASARRTEFTVGGQLMGKIGLRGYGQLLDQLTAKTKRPRRRGRKAA